MNPILWLVIKSLILGLLIVTVVAGELLFERKILGYFQYRYGPNRVGPWGLLQLVADAIKMMLKEDIIPNDTDKIVFRLAPIISFFTALAVFVVIPWGPGDGMKMADPAAGILVLLAITSLSVYGVALGGWASQSKYSLLGSMRATAQLISYELSMSMAILGVVLMAGSTRMTDIVTAQESVYNIFPQILGFLVFLIALTAEMCRIPFDLPESENELVGGYHTEYSGMRFGLFYLTELTHLIFGSCLLVTLYLGGWNRIFFLEWLHPTVAYVLKVCAVIFFFIWARTTLARFRYDRLMAFGWKVMLPLAALNLVGTAVYVAFFA